MRARPHDAPLGALIPGRAPSRAREARYAAPVTRGRLALAAAVAAAVSLLGSGSAASAPAPSRTGPLAPCAEGVRCGTVSVPLDRASIVPGSVELHVEVAPAAGLPRGVMFLVPGGPGQSASTAFDLRDASTLWTRLFPGWTLATVDARGTGRSGAIGCAPLQAGLRADRATLAALFSRCAAQLGPAAGLYSTRDHAEDLEAVRAALGFERIGIWGTSYGTKLAVAYALAHPERVDRLVLDSVLPPEGPDALGLDTLRAVPRAIASSCFAGSCAAATHDPVGDAAAVGDALAAAPAVGSVRVSPRVRRSERVDGVGFLELLVEQEANVALAAELPAATAAARAGYTLPLLRLAALEDVPVSIPADVLSVGLFAATVCADGTFPWTPGTPLADRQAAVDAAVAALPPGSTGPFGPWAAAYGTATYCTGWPAAAAGVPLAAGPLPDVPVLILSGDLDLRTPIEDALALAARFPQARVVVAPGVGHGVLGSQLGGCPAAALSAWLAGSEVETACPRVPPLLRRVGRLPRTLAQAVPVRGVRGAAAGRVVSAVRAAVRDASAVYLAARALRLTAPVSGLAGGTLVGLQGDPGFALGDYAAVPGVALTGELRLAANGETVFPLNLAGTVTVRVADKAPAALLFADGRITGTLGETRIRVAQ